MKDEKYIFQTNLEGCSYRFLQQTAKAMSLPANVKKVYLVQLINAKNFSSQRELDSLVRYVREEQQQRALVRKLSSRNRRKKNTHQSPEISSTNNLISSLISKTPKQVSPINVQHRQKGHSPRKYPETVSARRLPTSRSDRVLRSSNRVTKRNNLLNSTLLTSLKGPESDERRESKIKNVSVYENKKEAASRTFAKNIIESWQDEGTLSSEEVRSDDMSPPLGKRARRLSGIYPLQPEDIKMPSVAVRRADGTISKIKAIIKRPLQQHNHTGDRQTQAGRTNWPLLRAKASRQVTSRHNSSSTFIVTASETVHRTLNTTKVSPSNRHIVSTASTGMPHLISSSSSSDETTLSNVSANSTQHNEEYYHKKIRAEQVRTARKSREMVQSVPATENDCLPKINEVFSMFNGAYSRGATRPLYVQVDTEHLMAPIPPQIRGPRCQYQGSSTLETIYNLKLPYQRTLKIPTTTNTHTVYSTHVISTAKAHPSSASPVHTAFNAARPPNESQPFYTNDYEVVPRATHYEIVPQATEYEIVPQATEYIVVPVTNDCEVVAQADQYSGNFQYHEQNDIDAPTLDFQRSCSSVETMTSQEQVLGANITIPEMMADAMEIISQDGDYMERMGMDIRMRCILCNWAGPKIILEYHIRKDHPNDIVECQSNEFCATYSLRGLATRRVWLSQVLQLCGELYVLSAKYDEPDCFMAALSRVSYNPDDTKAASMTTYNKVTGEPFTWKDVVTDLPPSMPYDNDPYNCFRLQLSKMDILPSSGNLKLMYRELVTRSPNKVIVGQPELDNIHINLAVKIFD